MLSTAGDPTVRPPGLSLRDWLALLRPAQWVKNLFVLAPLLFSRHLFDPGLWLEAAAAAWLFCMASAAVYAWNDVLDAERDRGHPLKANRPVAAGRIRPKAALLAATAIAAAALAGAVWLRPAFAALVALYLAQNGLYSAWLKRIALVDVLVIAQGFVLRVVGGALAIGVEFSTALVVCTFFLACLLGFGKRRHELESQGISGRAALRGYTPRLLRKAELISSAATLLAYLAYTVSPVTVSKFGTYALVLTLPFPAIGIFRFRRLITTRLDRMPTEALVLDPLTLVNLAAWVAVVSAVLYR